MLNLKGILMNRYKELPSSTKRLVLSLFFVVLFFALLSGYYESGFEGALYYSAIACLGFILFIAVMVALVFFDALVLGSLMMLCRWLFTHLKRRSKKGST